MIVTVPPRIKSFCERFKETLTEKRRAALAWMLAAYLLARGKRTQSEVARGVLSIARAPSSVSRRMRRESFRTREMVRAAMKRQLTHELWRTGGEEVVWFLPIDGVAAKRGGRTKVANAIQYKKKGRGSKGRSTKAHLFVMGVLITASGARIPLSGSTAGRSLSAREAGPPIEFNITKYLKPGKNKVAAEVYR